ncbi:MAG: 23S rRNA (pseudouridine(1915)-N(3))-methyltransferase RlmH [Sphingobacteriales bacterium]|nr:MAG: 23S rRNA (pseudouridine(1915)-N(3))-methyltransferase RlmH [Sphingobacteriales bacterium]
MDIEIWSIGKENDKHIEEGVQLYFKKTQPWNKVKLEIISVPKKMQTTDVQQTKKLEEALILKKLQSNHTLVLLDERGKSLDSLQWARQLQQFMNQGTRTLVILIGGAFGVSDAIREKASQVWSLSKLVFPHQLVRLILAEQVYRAFSILNNAPYHHE